MSGPESPGRIERSHPVPDASHRDDVADLVSIDLAPEVRQVHVDDVVVAVPVIAPDSLEQHRPGVHHRGPLGQRFEEIVLGPGQRHLDTVDEHASA